jgi:dicarboxylate transporter 10
MDEGKPLHLVAAIISGIVAITVCNPADVLKSRLMVQRGGSGEVAVPVNIWAVAKDIWLREGLRGFFRGWGPAYARAGPSFFIQMPIVEGLRSFLGVEAL